MELLEALSEFQVQNELKLDFVGLKLLAVWKHTILLKSVVECDVKGQTK